MHSQHDNQRILLVLDLDETLVHVAEEPLQEFSASHASFEAMGYPGVERPFLRRFFETVAEYFQLAVFSSAGSTYVHYVVNTVIRPLVKEAGAELSFVWGNERCTMKRDLELDRYFWVKNLNKVKRQGYPLTRVLLVDDTPEKAKLNYGNYIRIQPFTGAVKDEELLHLARYLLSLKDVENVRHIDKRTWRQDFC